MYFHVYEEEITKCVYEVDTQVVLLDAFYHRYRIVGNSYVFIACVSDSN